MSMFWVQSTCEYTCELSDVLPETALDSAQSWLLPGKPSASAAADANSLWPLGEPWTRSALQVSGSAIDGTS
jgi:hypothetical protein